MANMFKVNRSKARTINDVDMLLMVEKGIRGGICHVIHRYAKANNKYMIVKIVYKDSIDNKDSNKGYILQVDIEYPKDLHDLHSDFPFFPERMKINKCSKLVCYLHDKNNYVVCIRALKHAFNHGLI